MAYKYEKRINLKNAATFERLGLDATKMRLGVRNHTDRLITFLKPARARVNLREIIDETILEFVEACKGTKDKFEIRNIYVAFTNLKAGDAIGRPRTYELDYELLEFLQERAKRKKKD